MINVSVEAQSSQINIKVQGHAGFAEAGQDIICAGMSMLAYALAEAARRETVLKMMHEQSGEMEITLLRCYQARLLLGMFIAGAEMLAEQYPEHVAVNIPEGKII